MWFKNSGCQAQNQRITPQADCACVACRQQGLAAAPLCPEPCQTLCSSLSGSSLPAQGGKGITIVGQEQVPCAPEPVWSGCGFSVMFLSNAEFLSSRREDGCQPDQFQTWQSHSMPE